MSMYKLEGMQRSKLLAVSYGIASTKYLSEGYV